ncbi:MAG: LysM peptidoglycan-binding domain-containing protein [Bacilli bacterium]|nr:LysM peptidoglycan-binding domain-containing protein [Bacilli bacterium]
MAKKIVIDPGHGGNDSGAVGNGIIEKDYNLMISKYIYDRLKELGADVYITRDSDETLTPTERVNRVKSAFGDNKDVVVISNHINAGGGDGAEVIYALRNNDNLAKIILSELEKEGQNIRKAYQRRLPSDSTKDYYFMQRNTGNTESVTVEYGFLDSKQDDSQQLKNKWKDFGEAVVRAIAKYTDITYSLPKKDNIQLYTVVSGDSLWGIAKKYKTNIDEIKRANNLKSNLLSIGQVLKIPTLEDDILIDYIVQKGDTLYQIANKFNTTVNQIMKYNNLSSNLLSINQKLQIPNNQEINSKEYIVKSGDTLYQIAKQFSTTVSNLMNINNLKSTILDVGQILKII